MNIEAYNLDSLRKLVRDLQKETVVCSYLIAERKVNTLILLESTDLIYQWEEELGRFLFIDEEPPEYQTKTGRVKKRSSVIGTLKGGKDSLTGINLDCNGFKNRRRF